MSNNRLELIATGPRKLRLNVGNRMIIWTHTGINALLVLAVIATARPSEPGFIASSVAQFHVLQILFASTLLALVLSPFHLLRKKGTKAFYPLFASLSLFVVVILGALFARIIGA